MATEEKIFYYEDALINHLSMLAQQNRFVFRGYNKQDQLYPTLIRENDLSKEEFEFLKRLEKYGSHYFSAKSSIEFIANGQHYGLPTRLLDFTFNPFIALRFALFSAKSNGNYTDEEDKQFYYIRYCDLAENIYLTSIPVFHHFTFGNYEADSLFEKARNDLNHFSNNMTNAQAFDESEYVSGLVSCYADNINEKSLKQKVLDKKICFINPSQSNQRIIMQQGLFMLPYTLDKESHMQIIKNNTSVIKIDKGLRIRLLQYLDTLGYNTFRLMPDLSSICDAIKQEVKDIKQKK